MKSMLEPFDIAFGRAPVIVLDEGKQGECLQSAVSTGKGTISFERRCEWVVEGKVYVNKHTFSFVQARCRLSLRQSIGYSRPCRAIQISK